ncbi:interferon alpha-inducible protein 27-like protein 2A isoform X3 [Carcharodon carcharias]|uniref:interferon alpha-inducible protein 27-like protein 2A isoform X3 n=1 Tax=Carcharodon carcharias TaxID=13397 RepID=UPI001B7EE43E|nr:interferon alpha-inducible protein 27-like protein 2A isoform X3 [Carcharodon carcharias]
MKKYYLALLILVCFFSTVDASPRSKVVLMGLGAAFAISAAQCFIAALGFTATGIAAGSWAAKLMSIVASFNGGSVPPGSFVTTLQSIAHHDHPGDPACCVMKDAFRSFRGT